MSTVTRTRPQLIVTDAVLLRPCQATTSPHWPVLAVVLDKRYASDPRTHRLIDALDSGEAPPQPAAPGTWSIHLTPMPLLRLSLRLDGPVGFDGDILLPAHRLLGQIPLVTTARTIGLTGRRGADALTPGTDLGTALRHLVLVGPTPATELLELAHRQPPAPAARELQLVH